MRAVVLTKPHHVEVVDNWPRPTLRPDEVLVGMRSVGLCGSDLAVHEGHREPPALPWVMGHEGGGEILAVGTGVTQRHIGQRVVVEPNYSCFQCDACLAGTTSACTGRGIVGMNLPGLLAEQVAVPARFTWPVPDSVSDATLACVEPLAVARAAVRRAHVRLGEQCLVVGAGSQGLFLCQALLAAGAAPRVVEPIPGRLELAERIGAARASDTGEDSFAIVFDTAGTPDTWDISLRSVARMGTIVMIGMGSEPVSVTPMELARRQLRIRGSLIYDHPADFSETVASVVDGSIRPAGVLHERFLPSDAATAFALARSAPGKSWIDLSGWQEGNDG